jgi:NAD(P)-dependent dehydrogenase (short-subunit alcohol dehydrogenase family)
MKDKVVVITGAARGIGYGTATCFAAKGATVVIADMNGQGAQQAAEQLSTAYSTPALGLACDVTDRSQVEAMVQKTVETFGHIDVLVNNAGICPFIDVMEMDPATWQKTIDVNLNGAFHCTQVAAREMIKRGQGGRIIFITSLAENITGPSQVDYGASKGGLRMAMVGFATALGQYGITCNAIAPGMILTDMTRWHWEKPENAAHIKKRVPMGRIGTPEDIGKVAVFLASDDAEYVSGITVRVDGGFQTRAD